jgi:hypothetical protein
VIRFLWAKGVSLIEIPHQLMEVYDDSVMTVQNVSKWRREFENTRMDMTMMRMSPVDPPHHIESGCVRRTSGGTESGKQTSHLGGR